MTTEQANEQVAKAKGWKLSEHLGAGWAYAPGDYERPRRFITHIPDFVNDPALLWGLLCELVADGWSVIPTPDSPDPVRLVKEIGDGRTLVCAWPTLGIAVMKAWLAANGAGS